MVLLIMDQRDYFDFSRQQAVAEKTNTKDFADGYGRLCVAILEQAVNDAIFLRKNGGEKPVYVNGKVRYHPKTQNVYSLPDPVRFLKNKNNYARSYLEANGVKTSMVDLWVKNFEEDIAEAMKIKNRNGRRYRLKKG